MLAFRILLVAVFVGLAAYTGIVIARHGLGLLPVFAADVAAFGWAGQFNLDFLSFLVLAALWVAWRHGFGVRGLILAACVPIGGALFLTVYLLVESLRAGGDARRLVLGERL